MIKIILFIFPLYSACQTNNVHLFKVGKSLAINIIDSFKLENLKAYDLGNKNFAYYSEGKLSVFNFEEFKWMIRNEIVFSKFELKLGSGNIIKGLSRNDVSCIAIDENNNKIGISLKYGLFKQIDLKTKSTLGLWNAAANEIIGFKFFNSSDGYAIFYKFYPDSISLMGTLSIFKKKNISNQKAFYKLEKTYELKRTKNILIADTETLIGGISISNYLWTIDHNKERIVNTFVNDTLPLDGFDFATNDTLLMSYNKNLFVATGKGLIDVKLKNISTNLGFDFTHFKYNGKRKFIIAYNNKTMSFYRIVSGNLIHINSYNFPNSISSVLISKNGETLLVVH